MKISIQWMNFVLKWCERGRGLKPDWASKGLDFLLFAANPEITKYLTEDEFEVIAKLRNDCGEILFQNILELQNIGRKE